MLEKVKKFFDQSKSMLQESLNGAPAKESKAAPDDVTCEQLIREAKAYVDSIIRHSGKDRK